jgi:hypothetical protein
VLEEESMSHTKGKTGEEQSKEHVKHLLWHQGDCLQRTHTHMWGNKETVYSLLYDKKYKTSCVYENIIKVVSMKILLSIYHSYFHSVMTYRLMF